MVENRLGYPMYLLIAANIFRHKFTFFYAFEEEKHVAIQNGVKLTGIQKLDFCQIQWAK